MPNKHRCQHSLNISHPPPPNREYKRSTIVDAWLDDITAAMPPTCRNPAYPLRHPRPATKARIRRPASNHPQQSEGNTAVGRAVIALVEEWSEIHVFQRWQTLAQYWKQSESQHCGFSWSSIRHVGQKNQTEDAVYSPPQGQIYQLQLPRAA